VITVSLIGGLGNQMFQYAAGKALAERYGVPLALDVSGFRNYALRPFLLDRLQVPEAHPEAASTALAAKASDRFSRSLWRQRVDRMLGFAGLPKLAMRSDEYREPHFHFDPTFETLGPQAALFGYFQSERYFASIAERLRNWFAPREPLGAAAAAALTRIERSRLPISVHVRRGDYLEPGTAEFHGILGEPYYREALTRLEEAIGRDAELFVFSDDAAAAEQVLNFVPRSRLVHIHGDPERPWEDMTLMARCRHHVIANSSFSWWGAWLNCSPDKMVIAPRAWFAASELKKQNTSDLYPPGWVKI
jgi:Glycosyl transferase family 11